MQSSARLDRLTMMHSSNYVEAVRRAFRLPTRRRQASNEQNHKYKQLRQLNGSATFDRQLKCQFRCSKKTTLIVIHDIFAKHLQVGSNPFCQCWK